MQGENSQTEGNKNPMLNATKTNSNSADSVQLLLEQKARLEHVLNQLLAIYPTTPAAQEDKLQRCCESIIAHKLPALDIKNAAFG